MDASQWIISIPIAESYQNIYVAQTIQNTIELRFWFGIFVELQNSYCILI